MPKLSHENLGKHARRLQETWFDPVQKYLDKLVDYNQFEPIDDCRENNIGVTGSDTNKAQASESREPGQPSPTRKSKRYSHRNRKRQNIVPPPAPSVANNQPVHQLPIYDSAISGIPIIAAAPTEQRQEATIQNEEIDWGVSTNSKPANRRNKRNRKKYIDMRTVQDAIKNIDTGGNISPVIETAAVVNRRPVNQKEQPSQGHLESCHGNPGHLAMTPTTTMAKPLTPGPHKTHTSEIARGEHEAPAPIGNSSSAKKSSVCRRHYPKPGIAK
ncbi:hypothetical protein BGX27_009298 [Mortierella sp. AM989]|nr:hypothetical protein BGX27_009298 [Mortierella sp. AM989]